MTNSLPVEQLMSDYRAFGGYARELGDISHPHRQPQTAIAVLAGWLSELEIRWPGPEEAGRDTARLVLIQALNRRESRKSAAIPALLGQFDRDKTIFENARWSAGSALYDIPADDSYFDDLAAIAQDRSLGSARQMIVNWLGKSRRPEAIGIAVAQLNDETVQGHALEALAKLRAQGVRDHVEPFAASKNAWHRRTAQRILRNLAD
ncbi:HEAT repeat domain-containing protein [Nocardia sp. NPDC058058]|uniref:HEAT repeat domain-containing protein n=1 Tax=Nocardia sp. NPDC058058 TaxID=3346317 RepID=UPI0036DBA493